MCVCLEIQTELGAHCMYVCTYVCKYYVTCTLYITACMYIYVLHTVCDCVCLLAKYRENFSCSKTSLHWNSNEATASIFYWESYLVPSLLEPTKLAKNIQGLLKGKSQPGQDNLEFFKLAFRSGFCIYKLPSGRTGYTYTIGSDLWKRIVVRHLKITRQRKECY